MINKHFPLLFFLLLISGLFIWGIMREDSYLLVTADAPNGKLSLQGNHIDSVQHKIFREWKNNTTFRVVYEPDTVLRVPINGLMVAEKGIKTDYEFTGFYVLFLSLLVYRLKPPRHSKWWVIIGITAITIAGLMDILAENNMLRAINEFKTDPEINTISCTQIWLPSLLQFILLSLIGLALILRLFVLRYVTHFFNEISSVLSSGVAAIWKFRIVMIFLTVIFLGFWMTAQGQDMLMILNTSRLGTILFLVLISLWAVLNWYLPKLYDSHEKINFRTFFTGPAQFSPEYIQIKLDAARIIGVTTFLVPAASILVTMQNFHILRILNFVSPLGILATMILLYYVAAKRFWIQKWYTTSNGISMIRIKITLAVITLIVTALGLFNSLTVHSPVFLLGIFVDLILFSFVFFLIATLRNSLPGISRISITPFVIIPGVICFFVFLYCNFFAGHTAFTHNQRFLTLPIIICAIIFYVLLFSIILLIGHKYRIQFITLILFLGIGVAATMQNPFHYVKLVKIVNYSPRKDSLEAYARQWLINRKQDIADFPKTHHGQKFPVFFINSYGGGIKATVWTTMALGRLDSLTQVADTSTGIYKKPFQHYVFAYSGSSGGTLGFSISCASLYTHYTNNRPNTLLSVAKCKKLFENDYLTPGLICMLGRDILMSAIGGSWYKDRAVIQEETWEKQVATDSINYNLPYVAYWNSAGTEYKIPLLFVNTYDAVSGYKGIIAPVKLNPMDFPATINVQDVIQEMSKSPLGLKMSTAAFLSARFPYISPTGNLNEKYHFADAGYNENSGAETLMGIVSVFRRAINKLQLDSSSIYKEVDLKFISISNNIKDETVVEKPKVLLELTAPFMGLFHNREGYTKKSDSISKITAIRNGYGYYSISPTREKIKSKSWPVLPTGWQISDDALEQMQISINKNKDLHAIAKLVASDPGKIH